MKTTTYIYTNAQTTITVSDKPVLTKAQYAHACRVLSMAALDAKSRKQAIDILREAAIQTQVGFCAWSFLIDAAKHVKGGF